MTTGQRQPGDLPAADAAGPRAVQQSDWRRALAGPDTPLSAVVPIVRTCGAVVVVDGERRLLGTITDGDIRRALLDGGRLDRCVGALIESAHAPRRDDTRAPRAIVDDRQCVVGIQPGPAPALADRLVVVMAGGLGRRLRPLTYRCPKPLLPVGGRPLLERTIELLCGQGFRRFVFCVGYRADAIERHFGNGRTFGVRIDYVHDRDRLGTAGPLALLEPRPSGPLLVINGDIITTTDLAALMTYHEEEGAAATMAVCEMSVQVPYGVVSLEAGRVAGILEKPVHPWRVNAGVYVLEPGVLDAIPPQRTVSMPEILNVLIQRGDRVAAFPIHEQWIDIGNRRDLARARATLTMGGDGTPEPPRAAYGKQAPSRGKRSNSCSMSATSPAPHLITS